MSEESKENDETEREDCEEEEEEEGGKGDNSAAKTPVSLLQVPLGTTTERCFVLIWINCNIGRSCM